MDKNNLMRPEKAALESSVRYIAADLAGRNFAPTLQHFLAERPIKMVGQGSPMSARPGATKLLAPSVWPICPSSTGP